VATAATPTATGAERGRSPSLTARVQVASRHTANSTATSTHRRRVVKVSATTLANTSRAMTRNMAAHRARSPWYQSASRRRMRG
jgi:hypothetical protein